MMLHRVGLQLLVVRYARSKASPSAARASRLGVLIALLPKQPRSSCETSSAMMNTKLGRSAAIAGETNHEDTKSTKVQEISRLRNCMRYVPGNVATKPLLGAVLPRS